MKFSLYALLLFGGTLLLLNSCAVNRYIAPPFTDLDKILKLDPGMSVTQVSDLLLIEPYDIIHSYETGNTILVYNYRVKDRNLPVPSRVAQQIIHSEDGQRDGDPWYNTNYLELYLSFSHDTLKGVYGERTFMEGTYLEMIEGNIAFSDGESSTDAKTIDKDYLFLQNLYRERSSFKRAGQIQGDEVLSRRRKLLQNGLLIAAGLVGIKLISGI